MKASDKKIRVMGKRVLKESGRQGYREHIDDMEQPFVDLFYDNVPRRVSAKTIVFAASFAAAAAVVLMVILIHPFATPEIPFWIGSENTAGRAGSWVAATRVQQTAIRFQGGSQFVLSKKGSARIIESNNDRVVVDLTSGDLKCEVVGNGKTRWIVRAGTYQVLVTGTGFTVQWAPQSSILNVIVTKGSVLVSGAALKPHGISLVMGDHLTVNSGKTMISNNSNERRKTSTAEPASSTSTIALVNNSSATTADKQAVQTGEAEFDPKLFAHNKPKATSVDVSQWKKRYAKKEFAQAILIAKSQGLGTLARILNSDDLWKLSRAARFAQDGGAAHQLLSALVERFPGTLKAHNATFLLGRTSEELLHDNVGAKKWYEKYLARGPKDVLSEQALGRLIGVCDRSGFTQQAQNYAKRYLVNYPKGLFVPAAQSVLE